MKKRIFFVVSYLIIITTLSCQKEVFTTEPNETKPTNSKIIASSYPEGAKIYLDGKYVGCKTPDSLNWLQPGAHTITLKLGLFPDRSYDFQIQDSVRLSWFYNYYSDSLNYGKIYCTSMPSAANVIFNDTYLNRKTPIQLDSLMPGEYKLKVEYPGCRADSSIVRVIGGHRQNISFVLDDTTYWVGYSMKNSPISDNHITTVVVDKDNVKWIGGMDGSVYLYDGSTWIVTQLGSAITCMAVDQQNIVWVGTEDGLYSFDRSLHKWVNYNFALASTHVNTIAIDKNDFVWVGTENGLARYNRTSWQLITTDYEDANLISNFITSLAVDTYNRIWIGTDFGINVVNRSLWETYRVSDMNLFEEISEYIRDIEVDKDGTIWIAHKFDFITNRKGGIVSFNGTDWRLISFDNFSTNYIKKIFVDTWNYKWVISTSEGMGKFSQPDRVLIVTGTDSAIPTKFVNDCIIDINGDLWVATGSIGIVKLKKGNF
ncbi:MAG: PEGA domain-containing protein [Ignavibacteriales bacterium]|nr:PEGA domain-containing protein [Ignavibacteriales bacterium]